MLKPGQTQARGPLFRFIANRLGPTSLLLVDLCAVNFRLSAADLNQPPCSLPFLFCLLTNPEREPVGDGNEKSNERESFQKDGRVRPGTFVLKIRLGGWHCSRTRLWGPGVLRPETGKHATIRVALCRFSGLMFPRVTRLTSFLNVFTRTRQRRPSLGRVMGRWLEVDVGFAPQPPQFSLDPGPRLEGRLPFFPLGNFSTLKSIFLHLVE